MDSRTDTDLLQLARKFDLHAISTIYDRYNQALYYYSLRLLGDPVSAEDCVADVFSRLTKAFHGGMGPDNFLKAYLYHSAHNWITDYYRRESSHQIEELTDEIEETGQNDPLELADKQISQERLRAALSSLTPDQRQVICLRYLEGWELDEVARSVNKPIGAVKALQHRAISALQKLLKQEKKSYGLNYELQRQST